jgi:virginiamycin B lyase
MQSSASCARVLAASFALVSLASALRAQGTLEYTVPTANSRPYTIVAGLDGAMWFTESNGNKIGRITLDGVITEFPVPTAGSGPYGICLGPDKNIWFTERFADKIGRLVPSTGVITEFPVPTAFSQPWEIAPGADGNLWFTEDDAYQIGKITTTGSVTEFPMSTSGCCFPIGIAPGPGGDVWYTLEIGDQIGRIQPGDNFTQYPVPTGSALPWDIIAGPDARMWFTELGGRNVGAIDSSGNIVEYPVSGAFSGIAGIAAGPDGNMWFTENDVDQVRGMTTSGVELDIFGTSTQPLSICLGPDGNMWYTTGIGNTIGTLLLAEPGVRYVLSTDAGFIPTVRNAQLGETVKWVFQGASQHWVNDGSQLGFYFSDLQEPVSYFTFQFPAAGGWVVGDVFPFTRGGINIPVVIPTNGSVGVPFEVLWAEPAMPAGLVEDVIVQTPGSGTFTPWITSSAVSDFYTPTTPGAYVFRARLRDPGTGNATFYSRPVTVDVL